MSLEIEWKQNILVTDSNLLKSLLVVCGISRQNICSVPNKTVTQLLCRKKQFKSSQVRQSDTKTLIPFFQKRKTGAQLVRRKKRKISCHTGHNDCGIFPVPCLQIFCPFLRNVLINNTLAGTPSEKLRVEIFRIIKLS